MTKLLRSFTFGIAALTIPLAAPLLSIDDQRGELDREDIQALRDWLNTKRQVTVREIGGNLSISGQVRTEFQRTNEVVNGIAQRGHDTPSKLPTNAYDVEVNL